ncbi:PsbP domain-containing protein 7- chloroplastic [Striga hermonthica]|uniref:PsbP domain-containing protein 7- chloroplastic n=1 Tax=Striga hermonthica TaxID=68872 RepID=A0A9N7RAJ5_STRHE|nr:PsbP domain-containing protein 7- chloroplastic [Striga hermonthica]
MMGARPMRACHRTYNMTQSSEDGGKQTFPLPAEQFRPLQSVFRRRLLNGIGAASLLAVGANLGGVSSFLLSFSPEAARSLKLDALYPVGGYSRYIDTNEGFGEVNEPVVAFGPPGSTGELNVSVIVSTVPIDFSIEAFGGAERVGEAVLKTITVPSRGTSVKGTLIGSSVREGPEKGVKYCVLEFGVESSIFRRHNIAVCCARKGRLFTLNAQAPESAWPQYKAQFYVIADSFILV